MENGTVGGVDCGKARGGGVVGNRLLISVDVVVVEALTEKRLGVIEGEGEGEGEEGRVLSCLLIF
jgi:hypothetical protein